MPDNGDQLSAHALGCVRYNPILPISGLLGSAIRHNEQLGAILALR
jgi:hypothetical protein